MNTLTQEQLKQDLSFFRKGLLSKHPNPFKYLKRKEFEKILTSIENTSLSIKELGFELMKLLAKLRDGHAELDISFEVLGTLSYPLRFKYINDGYYVVGAGEEYKEYLGAKLLKINDKSINEIENILKEIIPIENDISLRYYLPSKLIEPEILNYFGISEGNSSDFTFQTDGKEIRIRVKALDYNTDINSVGGLIKKRENTLEKQEKYWINDMSELNAVYFQYNDCDERNDYKMSSVVKDIKKLNRPTLIINLRNNRGGGSDVLIPVLRYIKRNSNNLKVFVISGVDTYSSGIYNLVQLAKIKNVTTIGEIPHGNPTHYGEEGSFILPNSKLKVLTSTKTYPFKGYRLGEIFRPDILIQQTINDYTSGKDIVLEHIKKNF